MLKITQSQIERVSEDLEYRAGEEVEVEFMDGAFWVFGSELATLRLLKKYRHNDNARQDYSENLESFYFVLDTQYFC